ncbi:2',3'-cyclic-nucleotide 3'-phosphodiesterase isoform X1 [Procambarus clarkii]|uniref:2',3'-cyclic-nucleotide 3'-phosphodiesterase isoform X1 n=2 Tax=Procambarus clarkii TaxID=6728 RepID=UPI003743F812
MEWLWRSCCSCWRNEVQEDEEEICSTTASELSIDVNSQQNSETMGQTVSRIADLLRPNRSADGASSDVDDYVDTAHKDTDTTQDDSSSPLIPVTSSPKYPLATPRSPLQRGIRRLTRSEISPISPPSKRLKGDFQYLDFPILKDEETINFILKSKVMFILKGVPGSGKSFLAKMIKEVYEDAVMCSADLYFMQDGEYKFDRDQLKVAHEFCQQMASDAAQENCHVIVIDNTNVRNWEMKFYLDLAKEYLYIPLVLEPQTPWSTDPGELAARNLHDIPEKIIAQKVHAYQPVQPLYYGWFMNEVDSKRICSIGQEWLQLALKVDDFFEDFSQNTQLLSSEEILQYFSRDSFVDGGNILHCTSKFTGRGKPPGALEYINSSHVRSAMGRCFQLRIIGFVITPRTLGARLRLTEEQLELWGNIDDEEPPANIAEPMQQRKYDTGSDNHNWTGQDDTSESFENKFSNGGCEPTFKVVESYFKNDRFHPTVGKGSRAHLTIACAPGIRPVNTGFDLINVVKCEQRALAKEGLDGVQLYDQKVETYTIPGGVLRTYGEGTWVIYPDKEVTVCTMFSACY